MSLLSSLQTCRHFVDITTQYLGYIKKMESLNLNIASEYIVMASELIEMKSKLLLPRHKDVEEEEEEDPTISKIAKNVTTIYSLVTASKSSKKSTFFFI